MMGTAIKWTAMGYGLLLTMAAGGFVLAQLTVFLAAAFQFGTEETPDMAAVETWSHRGWVLGVCLALLGAIAVKRKRSPKEGAEGAEKKEGRRRGPRKRRSSGGRRLGFLASSAVGCFAGALLGGMLGGTFLFLWFSLTYSPFAPEGWGSSVSVEGQRTVGSAMEKPALTTDHPVAQVAVAGPLVLGAVAGAVWGGMGEVRVEK